MDSSRLHNILDNIYIPKGPQTSSNHIPSHHPTLIMQDYQTDTTHHLKCGCCAGACIEENAWWNRKSSASQKKNTASTNPRRPIAVSTASSSSISSNSSNFSLDSYSESSISDFEN